MNDHSSNNQSLYFHNPQKETYISLILAISINLFFTILFFIGDKKPTPIETYDVTIIWNYLLLYGLVFIIPVIILLFIRKHSLETISVQRRGLFTNLACTSFLMCIGFYFTRFIGYLVFVTPLILLIWYIETKTVDSKSESRVVHFLNSTRVQLMIAIISIFWLILYALTGGTIRTGESLISFSAFIGFWAILIQAGSEELVFHGYFQFRAIDWLGEKKGIILTSSVFTLGHLTMAIAVGMSFPTILLFLILIFITDIPIGFLTHKTQNLTGAILLHTFANLI